MKADLLPFTESEADVAWYKRYFGPEFRKGVGKVGELILLSMLMHEDTQLADRPPQILAYEYCVTDGSQTVEVKPGDTPLGLSIEHIAGWKSASQAEITEHVHAMPGNTVDSKNFTASGLRPGPIDLPEKIQCRTTAVNLDGLFEILHNGRPIIETN